MNSQVYLYVRYLKVLQLNTALLLYMYFRLYVEAPHPLVSQ